MYSLQKRNHEYVAVSFYHDLPRLCGEDTNYKMEVPQIVDESNFERSIHSKTLEGHEWLSATAVVGLSKTGIQT